MRLTAEKKTKSASGKYSCCCDKTTWEIILDDLRRVTHFARQNELLFAKHTTRKSSGEVRREMTQTERELETMRRRDTELTTLFKRLYEDNVLGKIPNEVFRKRSDDYLAGQKEIQSSIPFIEKIVVGERGEKQSSTAAQEIHIYYRDISLLGDLTAQPSNNSGTQQPKEVA